MTIRLAGPIGPLTRLPLLAIFALAMATGAACDDAGGGDGGANGVGNGGDGLSTRVPPSLLSGGYPEYLDESSGIRTILGTPDLGVGAQRVAFVMNDDHGLVRLPVLNVRSYYYPDGEDGEASGPIEEERARFYEFPLGTRGLYSFDLTFDDPGTWGLAVDVPRADGSVAETRFTFDVAEEPLAPAVGDPAPPSDSRTLDDVESLVELSTGHEPDEALYQQSLAEAVAAERPFVVVFASPAFCTNALCGPQVEMLSELHDDYGDDVTFIHIDLYENPDEIQGDLDRAIRTPVLEEWGIETDEWTFIVDESGRVAARFEAFVPREELEASLVTVLEDRDAPAPAAARN